jgi:hypothetical protein
MNAPTTRRIPVSLLALLALLGFARGSSADCAPVRPATAEEQQIYADGRAAFRRMAPPAPAGWTAADSPSEAAIAEVCAAPSERVTRWGFTRQYERSAEELAKRLEVATQKTMALMQEPPASPAEAEKFEAATKAIEAEQQKDVSASFSIVVNDVDFDAAGWTPATSTVGKAYRQAFEEANGNLHADLKVVLPKAADAVGPTIVQISGDPERVDALREAADLP